MGIGQGDGSDHSWNIAAKKVSYSSRVVLTGRVSRVGLIKASLD